ncbi:glycerophosphoryl diester phosphodiesterase [bacterium]|nr:glycerophosphoryl diester phosphodiesterase [bacterium]
MAKPIICGHRGVAARAPENTLAGLELAAGLGLAMVEVDVRLTRDGVPVLFHDAGLGRTAPGRGAIGNLRWSALDGLDAGCWFGPEFAGTRIPTLADALAALGPDMGINLELKTDGETGPERMEALVKAVLDFVTRTRMEERCVVTSFDREAVRLAASLEPDLPCGPIIGEGDPREALREASGLISIRHGLITPATVVAAHAAGCAVHAWTVNDPKAAERLAALGVDVIITDDPEMLQGPGS